MDGALTEADFNHFLRRNGVFNPTEIDVTSLFRKFDLNKTGQISINEFLCEL